MKRCILQDEHERMGKRVPNCFHCDAKIGKTIAEKWEEAAAQVPIENKQLLMNAIRNGKTIGEAKQEAGIEDLGVAIHIINGQIRSTSFLDFEVKPR